MMLGLLLVISFIAKEEIIHGVYPEARIEILHFVQNDKRRAQCNRVEIVQGDIYRRAQNDSSGKNIQLTYELEPVVVIGSRISSKLPEVLRSITIITSEEIKELPVHSISELLNYSLSVDIRQRNFYGVQADPSIRGAGFEQVLILIDGVKADDPQTGHHSLNIPVGLYDIERIEILRGQGSSLYGANAFGGVINIITKNGTSKSTGISGSYGNYGTHTLATHSTQFNTRLSIGYQKSDGYRYDTDFDNLNLWAKTKIGNVDINLGLQDKKFGAYGFYAPSPSWEKTRTKFGSIKMQSIRRNNLQPAPTLLIEPTVYYREHYDKFVYIREEPNIYTNYHTNYKYGGELLVLTSLNVLGNVAFGGEVGEERIESTGIRGGVESSALGYHNRQNVALYIEHQIIRAIHELPLHINTGARADYNSQYKWNFSPSLAFGYLFSTRFKLRGSCGRTFRAPTFTELYYESLGNIGNPNLLSEKAFSYELGIDYSIFSGTLFTRNEDNLIDWIKPKSDTLAPWEVKNIKEANIRGVEIIIELPLWKHSHLTIPYTIIQSEIVPDNTHISKYALNYPEHMLAFKWNSKFSIQNWILSANTITTFKSRVGEVGYWVSSAKLSTQLSEISFFFEAKNLLNTKYEEIPGIELPGRWLTVGASVLL